MLTLFITLTLADPALAYGDGGCGKLEGGVALPCSGKNFEAFSLIACGLGRSYLHPLVAQTVTDAFAALENNPRIWQYGETGWKNGGRLRPHRTHQNGLAADFFMPMRNDNNEPQQLPISLFNELGYGIEIDARGFFSGLHIDWRAIADHLLALQTAGLTHQVSIERVILTPRFREALFAVAPDLAPMAPKFMRKEAWVKHDEHYHVDFAIPAELRRPLTCAKE